MLGVFLMKKLVLVFVVLAAISGTAAAIDLLQYPPPVKGGNVLIDLGIGFSGAYGTGGGGSLRIPPLFATVEYALPVNVPISVGGTFAFWQYGYNAWSIDWRYTYMSIGARGNWHWAFDVKWLDFYTGLFLGYLVFLYDYDGTYTGPSPNYSRFDAGLQAGAHFYFTEKVGAVVEFGYPIYAKAGVALKF